MKTATFIVIDSILVLALAVYIVYLHQSFETERDGLMRENEALKQQVVRAQGQLEQLAALEARADSLSADVEAAAQAAAVAEAPSTPVEPAPAAQRDASAEAAQGGQNPMAAMMKMFEGEEGKKMRDAGARAQVQMQYGAFLDDLALPPDVDAQVRDVLAAYTSGQIERNMALMNQDEKPSGKEMRAGEDKAREELRTQLAQVLTEDELAQWDEYAADIDRHILEQNVDMQMNMFGASMDDETRQIVRDAVVDELLASQEEFVASDKPMGVEAEFERQASAFSNVREALAGRLAEEQFAQADRFLTQQEQMVAASMEMVRGMMGNELPGSPPEPDSAE